MHKSRVSLSGIDPAKAKLREDIKEHIETFFASGGSMEQCDHGQSSNIDVNLYSKARMRGLGKMNEQN